MTDRECVRLGRPTVDTDSRHGDRVSVGPCTPVCCLGSEPYR